MKILLIVVLVLHGAIHALGFVKGVRLADIAQLPAIGPWSGLAWLAATILLLTSAALLVLGQRPWWMVAVVGILLSQALILTTWSEAKYGTVANAFILLALLLLQRDQSALV